MRTLFIGRQLIQLDVVDSTNNYAASMLSTSKLAEGAVIMAHEQNAGKGQRGAKWSARPGENLTVTVVLSPSFLKAKDQFYLSMITALAVMETIRSVGVQAVIKWPNDVLTNGRKISGVLIENSLSGDRIQHALIGIGLNVNQCDFPSEIKATSLRQETEKNHDLLVVLSELCGYLEKWYLLLRQEQFEIIRKEYLQNLLNLGISRNYSDNQGMQFVAIITGVSPEGRLELMKETGERCSYDVKEISLAT